MVTTARPGFRLAVERAEAEVEVRLVAMVLQAAVKQPSMATWWLERRRPASYGRAQAERAAVAATGAATSIAPHPLDGLSPTETVSRARAWAERLSVDEGEADAVDSFAAAEGNMGRLEPDS